jgi:hypothetical protein
LAVATQRAADCFKIGTVLNCDRKHDRGIACVGVGVAAGRSGRACGLFALAPSASTLSALKLRLSLRAGLVCALRNSALAVANHRAQFPKSVIADRVIGFREASFPNVAVERHEAAALVLTNLSGV